MSSSPHESSGQDRGGETVRATTAAEWVGSRGDKEPDACAAMTPAERIQMVWPITATGDIDLWVRPTPDNAARL